jgi:hypothetical protein
MDNLPNWKPDDPCPCGSGIAIRNCCFQPSEAWLRVKVPNLRPPAPRTGVFNPQCYLAASRDCSLKKSGEHYISASVIKALGGQFTISGFPWQEIGEERAVGINSLRSNVLCKRHNEALSPIDAAAERFFRILQSIMEDIFRASGELEGTVWYLVSGEMLELWLTKTLFGLYPKIAAKNRARLSLTQSISEKKLRNVLKRGGLLPPDGLYAQRATGQGVEFFPKLSFSALSVFNQEVVGLNWKVFSFAFDFLFDSSNVNMELFKKDYVYRPSVLRIKRGQRCHAILMTWPKLAYGDGELSYEFPI